MYSFNFKDPKNNLLYYDLYHLFPIIFMGSKGIISIQEVY